jgi:hypothetical protein
MSRGPFTEKGDWLGSTFRDFVIKRLLLTGKTSQRSKPVI